MTALYDWKAEGDFEQTRTPSAGAVRRALLDLAAGRLPSLGTLRRAVGVDRERALAIRDHLAHVLIERDACTHASTAADAPRGDRADGGAAGAPAESAPSPVDTPPGAPVPDPVCPRALEEFADELAEGAVPSLRQIMRRLHVGAPRAARIRGFLIPYARRAA